MFLDRTQEFLECVDLSKQFEIRKREKVFYCDLFEKIEELQNLIRNNTAYGNFLQFEDVFLKLQKEVQALDMISIKDKEEVFEGIKWVLTKKLFDAKHDLENIKMSKSTEIYEHEDLQNKSNAQYNTKRFNEEELVQLELENKQIIKTRQYETTQKKLQQINKVQLAINEHLTLQNERIDDVCTTTKDTKKMFKDLNKIRFDASGSWFKRFTFKFIIFLTILLAFLHNRNR